MKKYYPKIGETYGNYTVIDIVHVPKYVKHRYSTYNIEMCLCKCKCGKERLIQPKRLFIQTRISCISCANSRRDYSWNTNGVGDITGTFFNDLKRGAKSRDHEWNISKEYLWELFLKQNKKCKLSGIDLHFNLVKQPKYGIIPDHLKATASLDRIDNNKGYIEGNVQWVHKWINIMKNLIPNNLFIQLCHQISIFNKDNFEPSLAIEINNLARKVQRLTVEDTLSNNTDTSVHHPNKDEDIV